METTATQNPSRKRKQHSGSKPGVCNSSSPFAGIVTRQKSQKYFFSHNRSGKFRKCRSIQVPFTQVAAKVVDKVCGDDNDDGDYCGSIKDLRLRRVFSKPIVKEEKSGKVENNLVDCNVVFSDRFGGKWVNGGNTNFVVLKKCDLRVDGGDSNLNDVNHESTMSSMKCDNGGNLMVQDLDCVNPKSTVLENCVDIRVDSLVEDLNGVNPNSLTDCRNPNLTVTEKSVDIRVGFVAAEGLNDENPKLPVLKKCDSVVTDKNTILSISEKGVDSNDDFVAGDLMTSENCDHVISSVIRDVLESQNCGNLTEKCEFAEGRVGDTCEALEEENVQTTPPDAVVSIRKSDEHNNVLMSQDSGSRSVTKQINPTKEMTFSKSSRKKVFKVPNSFTYKRLLPYLMDIAKDEPCTPNTTPSPVIKMEVEEKSFVSISQESTIESKDDLFYDPKASETDLVPSESQLPDDSEQDMSQDQNISLDNVAVSLDSPESSPNEANMRFKTEESSVAIVVSSDAPVGDQTKGILKRNPRGCRGICSCLNCSSFRLNADKAFEFSKNQLLEAEEVARDLMKELSNLRCMLKESLTQATEVNQVEEACRRASYVENLARSRLTQMNEDLNVHCRTKALHRPRVNFCEDENVAGDLN